MGSKTRDSVMAACERLLPPLIELLLRLGISAADFNELAKGVFVRAAAQRATLRSKRVNRSQIAIVTGLTRSEVARLLKRSRERVPREWHAHRADRVLRGWHSDPEFVTRTGRPRTLAAKGHHGSFQHLVRRYSGDIPARAMLDELVAGSAARVLRDGSVRALASRIVTPRIGVRELQIIGARARALLNTLCHNSQRPRVKLFISSTSTRRVDERFLDVLLRRIEVQGTSFLRGVDDQLTTPPRGYGRTSGRSSRVGVTVFVHSESEKSSEPNSIS
jgi:hypothetical protein